MRCLKWILCCLTLLLLPLAVQAQPSPDWQVVVYEFQRGAALDHGGALDVITASGIAARHVLPASILPDNPYTYPQIAVSDDLRYAAVVENTDDGSAAPPISILDLTTGRCCTVVTPPLAHPETYLLAGFSADSAQLAFAYAAFPDLPSRKIDGGLVVADVASGQIVATLDLSQIQLATDRPQASFAEIGAWTDEGIRFVPGCWSCPGGEADSAWYLWNPVSGAVVPGDGGVRTAFGDTLPLTGELLYTINHAAYPTAKQPGYILPANVVEYYADGVPDRSDRGQQTAAPNATLVYFDPYNLSLPLARWVADGRAFVLQGSQNDPLGTVVFRDQRRVKVGYDDSDRFLAATPEGWLAQDADNGINHYVVGDGTVTIVALGAIDSRVSAVWSPRLGQSGLPPLTSLEDVFPAG